MTARIRERAVHEFLRVLHKGILAEEIQEVLSPHGCNVELCSVQLVYGSAGWHFPAPFQATGMSVSGHVDLHVSLSEERADSLQQHNDDRF